MNKLTVQELNACNLIDSVRLSPDPEVQPPSHTVAVRIIKCRDYDTNGVMTELKETLSKDWGLSRSKVNNIAAYAENALSWQEMGSSFKHNTQIFANDSLGPMFGSFVVQTFILALVNPSEERGVDQVVDGVLVLTLNNYQLKPFRDWSKGRRRASQTEWLTQLRFTSARWAEQVCCKTFHRMIGFPDEQAILGWDSVDKTFRTVSDLIKALDEEYLQVLKCRIRLVIDCEGNEIMAVAHVLAELFTDIGVTEPSSLLDDFYGVSIGSILVAWMWFGCLEPAQYNVRCKDLLKALCSGGHLFKASDKIALDSLILDSAAHLQVGLGDGDLVWLHPSLAIHVCDETTGVIEGLKIGSHPDNRSHSQPEMTLSDAMRSSVSVTPHTDRFFNDRLTNPLIKDQVYSDGKRALIDPFTSLLRDCLKQVRTENDMVNHIISIKVNKPLIRGGGPVSEERDFQGGSFQY